MTSPRSESYRRSEPSRDSREDMDRKYYDSRDKDKDYRSSRDTRDSSDRERNYYSSSRSASTRHFDQDSYKSSRYETSRRSRSPSRRDEYIDRSYKSREYSPTRSSRDRAYSPSRSSRGRINTPETTTRPIRSPAYIPASAYRESSYGRDEKLKVEPFNNYERPCQSTTSTSYTPAPKVYNNISTNAYSARVSSNAPYVPSQPAYSYSHPVPPASSSMPIIVISHLPLHIAVKLKAMFPPILIMELVIILGLRWEMFPMGQVIVKTLWALFLICNVRTGPRPI